MSKSDIKTPTIARATAIITRDDERDSLLTFGFVNQCYKMEEFGDVQALPFYIIKLMEKWVCFEMIHVIQLLTNDLPVVHWTMDVDKIIESTLTK